MTIDQLLMTYNIMQPCIQAVDLCMLATKLRS